MELVIIVLSKVSQTLKDKDPCFFPRAAQIVKIYFVKGREKEHTGTRWEQKEVIGYGYDPSTVFI